MAKHRFSDDDIRTRKDNAKKLKKKSFFSAINPKRLKYEIETCGNTYNPKQYAIFLFVVLFALIAAAFIFKLHFKAMIPIFILSVLFIPNIYLYHFRNLHEQKKFEDISNYIEQLLYSFGRQPKILTALQDTLILFQGDVGSDLGDAIEKAIHHIQTGVTTGNIYEEAFAFIEAEYGCKRLYKVHKFLIHAEEAGGDFENSIDLLILDRNLWMDRIYNYVRDKQRLRVNISIAIGLSLLIIGMSIYMVPESFAVTDQAVSQIVTSICLCIDFIMWFYVQRRLSGSLLKADGDRPFSEYKRSYDLIMDQEKLDKKKKNMLIVGIVIIAAACVAFFTLGVQVALVLVAFAIVLMTNPQRQYNACFKRVKKEIEKAFPEWLMNLALQMQTDNVHVSIAKTVPTAPEVLRDELYKFQDSIEKHPSELEPYVDFASKFQIANITSAMKQLYASAEFGTADAQEQIKNLVSRNIKVMERSEELRMEDELAGLSITMLMPMITGVVKLLVDLVLVFAYILSYTNGI